LGENVTIPPGITKTVRGFWAVRLSACICSVRLSRLVRHQVHLEAAPSRHLTFTTSCLAQVNGITAVVCIVVFYAILTYIRLKRLL
jgi:uncharacterized membrane protein